jgi:hypothetical protein
VESSLYTLIDLNENQDGGKNPPTFTQKIFKKQISNMKIMADGVVGYGNAYMDL